MNVALSGLRFWFITLSFVIFNFSLSGNPPIQEDGLYDLKCEYLDAPLGIDIQHPRFSWKIKDSGYNISQSAYRIKIYDESDAAAPIWNTGIVNSESNLAIYDGPALSSLSAYRWTVEVWNQDGVSYEVAESGFETAMIEEEDWQGEWISDRNTVDFRIAPMFRRSINFEKSISKARLYIAAAGLHHTTINGEEVSDEFLNPMFTRYDKRILYNTFDVTSLLQEGENVVGVILGNGWYNHQVETAWNYHEADWRNRPRFIANIKVWYEDGSEETISTDAGWKTAQSALSFNNIFLSEGMDFTRVVPGWDKPSFDDGDWASALITDNPTKNLDSQLLPPVRKATRYTATRLVKKSNTHYIYHFPKNIAGVIEFGANGSDGTILQLIHGEQINHQGTVDNTQFDHVWTRQYDDEAFHTDVLKLDDGPFHYSPKFSYKGFQYVEVISNQPIELRQEDMVAFAIHNDMKATGSMNTSNGLINKIWEASNNSYLSNMVGFPTDCPQREKNGWTGDAHIMAESGMYNYDAILVYEKWMRDHQDVQGHDGNIPLIVPTYNWGYSNTSIDWTSSAVLVPWDVYLMTGDTHILEDNYEMMTEFLEFWKQRTRLGIIWESTYGDWSHAVTTSRSAFLASAFYYRSLDVASRIAFILKKYRDFEDYRFQAEETKNTINFYFNNGINGRYQIATQTELSIALDFGLLKESEVSEFGAMLSEKVRQNDGFLDVGLLGSKSLLDALVSTGNHTQASEMIKKSTYPSWGFWINQGLTSFPENWQYSGYRYGGSLNHTFLGEVNAWFYKGIGGIHPDPNQPGFKNILLQPLFDVELGQTEVSHQSPYGLIKAETSPESPESFVYRVEIPANSTADLSLPAGYFINDFESGASLNSLPTRSDDGHINLGSGSYEFTISKDGNSVFTFPNEVLVVEEIDHELLVSQGALFLKSGSKPIAEIELIAFDLKGATVTKTLVEGRHEGLTILIKVPRGQILNFVVNVKHQDNSMTQLKKRMMRIN